MIPACCDGDKAAIRRRDIALAVVVVSPGDDGAILLEAKTVLPACCDGDKAGIGRRDIALGVIIPSPGNDGAILP